MNTSTLRELTIDAVIRDRPGSDETLSVPASSTVAQAVSVMTARDIGAVLVMDEENLVAGIFTERDLLLRVVASGRDPATTPISLVMTRDVRFVTPGTTIEAALSLMHVQRYRHLLVIDGPRVVGLVSMRDLAHQLIHRGEGRFEAAIRAASAKT